MAVIDNKKSDTEKVVAFEAGENDRNEELGQLLTNSQEELILETWTFKLTTTSTRAQSSLISTTAMLHFGKHRITDYRKEQFDFFYFDVC